MAQAPETITLDITTLTLGEMVEVEAQSGRSIDRLMRGAAGRRMVALFVHGLRSSGESPSWQQLSSRRLIESSPSTSPSSPDSASETVKA